MGPVAFRIGQEAAKKRPIDQDHAAGAQLGLGNGGTEKRARDHAAVKSNRLRRNYCRYGGVGAGRVLGRSEPEQRHANSKA